MLAFLLKKSPLPYSFNKAGNSFTVSVARDAIITISWVQKVTVFIQEAGLKSIEIIIKLADLSKLTSSIV